MSSANDMVATLASNARGFNRIIRQHGSSLGHPNSPNLRQFLANVEIFFLTMINQLQKQNKCKTSLSVLVIDINIGSKFNDMVHMTLTFHPRMQRAPLLPEAGGVTHPVPLFWTKAEEGFTQLVRMLEISETLSFGPAVMCGSLNLDGKQDTVVVTVPPCGDLIASPTSDTESNEVGAPAAENQDNQRRGDEQQPNVPAPEANHPRDQELPVTANASPPARPVQAVEANQSEQGPAAHVTNASRRARMSRALRSEGQESGSIEWGPVRAEGYFARYRRSEPHNG